jgi:hypothetical protein
MNELTTITRPQSVGSVSGNVVVPAAIAGAGEHATRRFLEFFAATIRNRNTRMAYYRACCSFFAWLDINGITELADIEPIHVAAYVEALQATNAKPTVKQHLAAVRMLFDWLVVGQVLAINPAHAVRGPKHVVKRGKTPVLITDDARRLLDSIPIVRKSKALDGSEIAIPCVVGLRDRALIAVMTYSLACSAASRRARFASLAASVSCSACNAAARAAAASASAAAHSAASRSLRACSSAFRAAIRRLRAATIACRASRRSTASGRAAAALARCSCACLASCAARSRSARVGTADLAIWLFETHPRSLSRTL